LHRKQKQGNIRRFSENILTPKGKLRDQKALIIILKKVDYIFFKFIMAGTLIVYH
jgi:hypothetical protein